MGDEQSLTNGVWSITIKKAEQNANGHDADAGVGKPAAEEDIAAHDNDEDTVPLGLTTKAVCMQISMSVLANVSNLSSGMGLGFPAITYQSLTNKTDPLALSDDEASWFASINAIACPLGGLLCSYVLDKYGRKRTLYTINVISILSWGLMAMASTVDKELMFTQLLVARFLIGICIGLSSSPSSVYSAEIAHPSLRGRISVLTSLTIGLGILLIYVLGFFIQTNWRLVSGICCGICVLATVLLVPIPETPTWLASKGRTTAAEKSLRIFKGLPRKGSFINPELQGEIDILIHQSEMRHTTKKGSMLSNLRKPEVYRPIGIMVGFFAFQQLSGIFVVVVYAAKFCTSAHVTMDPFLCVVYIGIVRVIAGMAVGLLLDRFGRRMPCICSGILMAVCMFGLAAWIRYPIEQYGWVPVALILTYVFTSTLGLLTIPFAMNAEIFPQKYRGLGSGLVICATYTICFICVKLYPEMVTELGSFNVCLLYGVASLLSIFYVHFILPETKGKSLQEIEDMFKPKPKYSIVSNIGIVKKSMV